MTLLTCFHGDCTHREFVHSVVFGSSGIFLVILDQTELLEPRISTCSWLPTTAYPHIQCDSLSFAPEHHHSFISFICNKKREKRKKKPHVYYKNYVVQLSRQPWKILQEMPNWVIHGKQWPAWEAPSSSSNPGVIIAVWLSCPNRCVGSEEGPRRNIAEHGLRVKTSLMYLNESQSHFAENIPVFHHLLDHVIGWI